MSKIKVVEWLEQITESGIQLGNNTTVVKRGELLSTHCYPATDQMGRQGVITLLVVRSFENNRILGIPSDATRYVGGWDSVTNTISDLKLSDDVNTVEPLRKSETTEETAP